MQEVLKYQQYELKTLRRDQESRDQEEKKQHWAPSTCSSDLSLYPLSFRESKLQVVADGIEEIVSKWSGKEHNLKRFAQMDQRFFNRLALDHIDYKQNVALPSRILLFQKYKIDTNKKNFYQDQLNLTRRNVENINLTAQGKCKQQIAQRMEHQDIIKQQINRYFIKSQIQQQKIIQEQILKPDQKESIKKTSNVKCINKKQKIKKRNINKINKEYEAIWKRVKNSGVCYKNSKHTSIIHQKKKLINTYAQQCKYRKEIKQTLNNTCKL